MIFIASSREFPHISMSGLKAVHIQGLSGFPKRLHFISSVRCIHLIPAGFPPFIPGIGVDIEMAIQHAPQF